MDDNTHHGHFMEQLIRKLVKKKAMLYVVLKIMQDLITDQNSKLMSICPLLKKKNQKIPSYLLKV